MIVIVAAFCLAAAYVSTSLVPRLDLAAATPPANNVARRLAPASNETCTRAEFQRAVALDVEDINSGEFGTSDAVWKSTSASGARQFFTKSFRGDDVAALAGRAARNRAP